MTTRWMQLVAPALMTLVASTACGSGTERADDRPAVVTAFVEELQQRWAVEDFEWLVQHLHPVTFEFWTDAECERALEVWDLDVTPEITVRDIVFMGDNAMNYGGGRLGPFEDAYRVTFEAQDEPSVMTVSFVEREPKWFTNCDEVDVEPAAGGGVGSSSNA